MKINRKDLVEALEIAKRFTSSELPQTQLVFIDTRKQKIVATDLYAWAEIGLEINNVHTQKMEVSQKKSRWPEEGFRPDLMSLKKSQLENLAEYMGIQVAGTKTEMVETIVRESMVAADEESSNDLEEVYLKESFLIDPLLLLYAVKTLSGDTVEIVGDRYYQVDCDTGGAFLVPQWINIHGYYKGIITLSPETYPEKPSFGFGKADKFICNLFRTDLEFINQVKADSSSMADFYHYVMFGEKEIVTTDGSRLYLLKRESGYPAAFYLKKKLLQKICPVLKDGPLELYAKIGEVIEISIPKKNVKIITAWTDINFPAYNAVVSMESHEVSVGVSESTWKDMTNQATVMNDETYKGIVMKFNSGLTIESTNPTKGEYGRHFEYESRYSNIEPPIEFSIKGTFLKCLPVSKVMTFHLSKNQPSAMLVEIDNEKLAAIMPMAS